LTQRSIEKAPLSTPAKVLLRRLVTVYLRPHVKLLASAFAFMALAAVMTGSLAILMQPIIDEVFTAQSKDSLWWVALAVFISFALRGFASYMQAVQMNDVGQRIVAATQRQLYSHLIRADLAYLHANASGSLLSRVINDVQVMRLAVGECLAGIGSSFLTLIILIGVMFWRDPMLAAISFIAFPLAAFFVARIAGRLRRVWKQTQEAMGQITAVMGQSFTAARQVKAYGTEGFEEQRIGGLIEQIYRLSVKSFRVAQSTTPVNEMLSGIAIVTVIAYGGMQVMAGNSSTGELFSFITAFLMAYEPIKKLTKLNAQLQAGLAAAERIFNVLDQPPAITDAANARELVLAEPALRFEGVTFAYNSKDGPVLNNISLDVPAGKTVALVGPSGAGKSSILNLVLRLYDVQQGAVRVSGQDVRHVTQASLRRHYALVSQEVAMFDDTIRNNIAYGTPAASDEQIIAAAQAAFAHEFIMALPQGYDTMVGEHGTRLSGGQRQRVSIARAMLRNAPILLLDEATSALDSESERAVQAALTELQKGRTTIAIAHRLSTICEADIIYVMENGRVIEQGNHVQLLASGGLYARLWRLQAGEVAA
jgi:ATP-binding cassette, subfamily B, bacterial MsbA